MPVVNGIKMACQSCIRGHRSTKCDHGTNDGRVLVRVRKPGRPLSSCVHDKDDCQECPPQRVEVQAAMMQESNCKCGSGIGLQSQPGPTPLRSIASSNNKVQKAQSGRPNGYTAQRKHSKSAKLERMDSSQFNGVSKGEGTPPLSYSRTPSGSSAEPMQREASGSSTYELGTDFATPMTSNSIKKQSSCCESKSNGSTSNGSPNATKNLAKAEIEDEFPNAFQLGFDSTFPPHAQALLSSLTESHYDPFAPVPVGPVSLNPSGQVIPYNISGPSMASQGSVLSSDNMVHPNISSQSMAAFNFNPIQNAHTPLGVNSNYMNGFAMTPQTSLGNGIAHHTNISDYSSSQYIQAAQGIPNLSSEFQNINALSQLNNGFGIDPNIPQIDQGSIPQAPLMINNMVPHTNSSSFLADQTFASLGQSHPHHQHEHTMFSYPAGYGTSDKPITQDQWISGYNQHKFCLDDIHKLPADVRNPPEAQHKCSCGDACQCFGCVAHPYNERTVQVLRDAIQHSWCVEDEASSPSGPCVNHQLSPNDANTSCSGPCSRNGPDDVLPLDGAPQSSCCGGQASDDESNVLSPAGSGILPDATAPNPNLLWFNYSFNFNNIHPHHSHGHSPSHSHSHSHVHESSEGNSD